MDGKLGGWLPLSNRSIMSVKGKNDKYVAMLSPLFPSMAIGMGDISINHGTPL